MNLIILLCVLWYCEESSGKLRISNKNKIDGDTSTGTECTEIQGQVQSVLRYKYRYRVYWDTSTGTECTEIQV